jgi:hypothetical protein
MDETKLTAHLPTGNVEMVVREHRDGDSDVMMISIRATPGFQALGQSLNPMALMWANPMGLWMKMAELAWRPWLGALGAPGYRALPKGE